MKQWEQKNIDKLLKPEKKPTPKDPGVENAMLYEWKYLLLFIFKTMMLI
jgi:hypothetical protein